MGTIEPMVHHPIQIDGNHVAHSRLVVFQTPVTGHVQHEGPDVLVFEALAHHFLGRLLGVLGQLPPELRQLRLGGHHRSRLHRNVGLRTENVLHHLVEAVMHVAIAVGILLGERGDRRA
jgi:hypothetical protein